MKLITVAANGQISIGKHWAGKRVAVQQVGPGELRIVEGFFVPADLKDFYTQGAVSQLKEFETWSESTAPQKTDLTALKARLGKRKKK